MSGSGVSRFIALNKRGTCMSDPKSSPEPSRFVRWLRFGTGVFLIWVLYLVSPAFFNAFAPLRAFNQIVQETDIMPGAMFYTNIPQSTEAMIHTRSTIRYFTNQQRNNPERD